MKRISFWILSTVSTLVLLVGFDASRHGGGLTAGTPPAVISSPSTKSGTGDSTGTTKGSTSGGTKGGTSGGTSGGTGTQTTTVTGDVAQTQWGPVQVEIAVRGGTITAVRIVQYPHGNSQDVEIANYALPILIQETTQNQSAQIDMVSGATFTSEGYVQSLQSALDKASL